MSLGPDFVQGWTTFSTGSVDAPPNLTVSYSQPAPTNRLLLPVACDGPITFPPDGWTQIHVDLQFVAIYLYERFAGPDDPTEVVIEPDGPYATLAAFAEVDGLDRVHIHGSTHRGGTSVDPIGTGEVGPSTIDDTFAVAILATSLSGGRIAAFSGWSNGFVEQLDLTTTRASGQNIGLAVAQLSASAPDTFETAAVPSQDTVGGGIMAVYPAIDTDATILRPGNPESGWDTPQPLALQARTPFMQATEIVRATIIGHLG